MSRCESKSWDDNKTVEKREAFFFLFNLENWNWSWKFVIQWDIVLKCFFICYVSITREASSLPTDLRVLEKRRKEDFRPKFQS